MISAPLKSSPSNHFFPPKKFISASRQNVDLRLNSVMICTFISSGNALLCLMISDADDVKVASANQLHSR